MSGEFEQKVTKSLIEGGIAEASIESVLVRAGHVGVVLKKAANMSETDADSMQEKVEGIVANLPEIEKSTVVFTDHVEKHMPDMEPKKTAKTPIPGVKKLIAVSSGKGGVGKSTIAANLAVALTKLDYKVGLVDADIHGPSIAHMMGMKEEPEVANKRMKPYVLHGVSCLSMGMLLGDDVPVIWRGPMISKALNQLMMGAAWDHNGELDYLVIDMPPGTGDIHLSIGQSFALDGVLMVGTGQEMAMLDVKKAINMYRKLEVPILGLVENMSYFEAPDGTQHRLLGGGIKGVDVDILASLPMSPDLSASGDAGTPYVAAHDGTPLYDAFLNLAKTISNSA